MKLRSQPRLAEGHRVPGGSYLPEHIEEGLREIARIERRSVSWVKAQIICDHFGIDAATGKLREEEETPKREIRKRLELVATRMIKASTPAPAIPFRKRA